MPHFICLLTFTQQGMEQLSATIDRAEAFRRRCEELGAKVLSTYWTLGMYDVVHILEAKDEKTAASLAMSSLALGNVRTHTLPAFTLEEMKDEILPGVRMSLDRPGGGEDPNRPGEA